MTNESPRTISPPPDPTVSFNPPLFLQRRGWILDIIRKEKPTSVLDIGCGEGALLSTLCEPAACLPSVFLSAAGETADIHVQRIAGLDISLANLTLAAQSTAPHSSDDDNDGQIQWTKPRPRWEDLQVQLWEGNLKDVNDSFREYECIIATEVIEHLHQADLSVFAPTLLGIYAPRLLLITTPSYEFNQLFIHPEAPPDRIRETGYPDPTGRTNRIFRHHDHKFEWTPEEFQAWCEAAAKEFGYRVRVSGLGRATEKDPWGRDDAAGWATQTALFQRSDDVKREIPLINKTQMIHKLLASHYHQKHPSSAQQPGLPISEQLAKEIRTKVTDVMTEVDEGELKLYELWNEDSLAVLCGGDVDILWRVASSHVHDSDSGQRDPPELTVSEGMGWNTIVKWAAYVKRHIPKPWDDETQEAVIEQSPKQQGPWMDQDMGNDEVSAFPTHEDGDWDTTWGSATASGRDEGGDTWSRSAWTVAWE